MRLLLCLLIASVPAATFAQHRAYQRDSSPQGRDIEVWGLGEETCREVLAEARSTAEVQPWVDGFLSALRRRGHRQYTGFVAAKTLDICRRSPELPFIAAVRRAL